MFTTTDYLKKKYIEMDIFSNRVYSIHPPPPPPSNKNNKLFALLLIGGIISYLKNK